MFFKKLKSVFIVAEISANHGGSLKQAKETIMGAKRAGADAIKLQTYTPETMTIESNNKDFIINNGSIWDGKNFYELYKEAHTPWSWHKELFKLAKSLNLKFFSTPFDKSSVDFLENMNVPFYKIASFEITDIPLIKYVASKGKPIILSTGIAELEDIELAIKTIRSMGNNDIVLLKCTSSYPSKLSDANLCMIKDLRDKFNVITGLSDHTLGSISPVLAVCYGAKIIEKHFILDHSIRGPDSSFSMDEIEFKEMVDNVRSAEKALGKVDYKLNQDQINAKDFSRSIYVVKNIKKGELFTSENIRVIRPGFGLHPKYYEKILNTKSNLDLRKGTSLKMNYIDERI